MTIVQDELFTSLGLPADSLTNQIQFIHLVREGMSGKVVKRAVQILDNRELFVRILDTTSGNLNRYYRLKKMTRKNSEEMLDTIRLYGQAAQVFGELEKAKEWIKTPIPALSGDKPEALFDTFEGRHWVSQVLRKIEYGEFV